jgi:hypothetical protein
LTAAVDEVLARALAKSSVERYPRCRDFTESLRVALQLPPYDAESETSVPDHPATVVVLPAPPAQAGPPETATRPAGSAQAGLAEKTTIPAWPTPAPGPAPSAGTRREARTGILARVGIAMAIAVILIVVLIYRLTGQPTVLLIILPVAIALAVGGLRARSRSRPARVPSVRVEPHADPPGQVAVRLTGSQPTVTVRVEPDPGASSTMIEEIQR